MLPANQNEIVVAKDMVKDLKDEVTIRGQYLMANRGYDSVALSQLLEEKNISPIIPTRQMWKDDLTRQYKDTDLIYNEQGKVYYVDEKGNPILLSPEG